jgi:hypothetical protein
MAKTNANAGVKRDQELVRTVLILHTERQLASVTRGVGRDPSWPECVRRAVDSGPVDEPLQFLKSDGALERLLRRAIDDLCMTNGSCGEREALVSWLTYFEVYLNLHLPESARDLYAKPLRYLATALRDLDYGFVHPPLQPAGGVGRPSGGRLKDDFRARCVVAADMLYGDTRSKISRQAADDAVRKRAEKAATVLGFSMTKETIKGWRRAIKEAAPAAPIRRRYQAHSRFLLRDDVRALGKTDVLIDHLVGDPKT